MQVQGAGSGTLARSEGACLALGGELWDLPFGALGSAPPCIPASSAQALSLAVGPVLNLCNKPLGQAAQGDSAALFSHCRAPPSSRAFSYGRKGPTKHPLHIQASLLVLFDAHQSSRQRTALPKPAWEGPQKHGTQCPAKAAHSALSKMALHHQPAPSTGNADSCLEQLADGCSRASVVWLPPLPFPATKGWSSIYRCSQR